MSQRALAAASQSGLIVPGEPLLVMLSGGADSVCLLDCALTLGARVSALHVNYGLRGEASDEDERFCRDLCERIGVKLHVERVTLGTDFGQKINPRPAAGLQTYADALFAEGLTEAEMRGRQIAEDAARFLQSEIGGFESAFLQDTAVTVGTGFSSVIMTLPERVLSDEDVASMLTEFGLGRAAGAVYIPLLLIMPVLALPPAIPFTDQTTD